MEAAAPAPEKLSLQKKKGKDKYILMEIKTERNYIQQTCSVKILQDVLQPEMRMIDNKLKCTNAIKETGKGNYIGKYKYSKTMYLVAGLLFPI